MTKQTIASAPSTLTFKPSRIIHGHWRLMEWGLSAQQLLQLAHNCIEMGIDTFDHADIYGNYSCEAAFGEALRIEKGLRQRIKIITKCGIKLCSNKFPERTIKTYDYSDGHIKYSVEQSLKNFHTDYIDLLLLHRPAPFFDPVQVAATFRDLKQQGKVLYFGVSNFSAQQYMMLQEHCEFPLITNQIELSPYHLEHFQNGNLAFCQQRGIAPMAWSPLAQGKLFDPIDDRSARLQKVLESIATEMGRPTTDEIIYCWLLQHPAHILPIVGSGKLERIRLAVVALDLQLSLEQWYRIYNSSTGEELP